MPETITASEIDQEYSELIMEHLKATSSLYEGYAQAPYNADVIASKSPPFKIYDQMRRDDQIKAVLWMKKFMILSSGWTLEKKEDTPDEVVDFLHDNLCNLSKPDFGDALINILSHLDYGFSITEPVFHVEQDDYIHLQKLKTRAPHTFWIYTDEFGDITHFEQDTATGLNKIDPKHIIHLVHQSEFGIPYGISDLQAAYRPWFSKDVIIKFWNIYLERFGNPLVWGTIPDTLGQTEKTDLLNAIKNLQAKAGLLVPEGTLLNILSSATGTTDFEKAIDNYNMMIARSMLVPDLIGISGGEIKGGSFALGEKHFEIFYLTVDKIRKDVENIINRRIIRPLCAWNFGIDETIMPKWCLNAIDTANRLDYLRLWLEAVRGNVWQATENEINHFREEIKFPKGDGIGKKGSPIFQYHIEGGIVSINDVRSQLNLAPVPGGDSLIPRQTSPSFSKSLNEKSSCHNRTNKIYQKRQLTSYEKKVDFEKVEKDYESLVVNAANTLLKPMKLVKEGLLDMVQSQRIIEGRKIEKVPDLKLKFLKDVQIAWRSILRESFDSGHQSAQSEIPMKKMASKFLPADIFEEFISDKSFFITGVFRDEIRKNAGQIILNGITKGSSTKDVISQLAEFFDKNYVFAPVVGDHVQRIEEIPGRLEVITRTNTTEAYNYGRRKFFEDPDLKDFVVAYQFSAIIDSRTTDVCEELDGKIYRIDDPYIDSITPPVHYNCRSLLVPITAKEEWKADKQAVSPEDLESFQGKIT